MTMINAWEGRMNWPIEPDWKCEICGNVDLIWGIRHGLCRCRVCHVQYDMRDEEGKRVTKPMSCLKPKYHRVFKKLWHELGKSISEITEIEWDNALATYKRRVGERWKK